MAANNRPLAEWISQGMTIAGIAQVGGSIPDPIHTAGECICAWRPGRPVTSESGVSSSCGAEHDIALQCLQCWVSVDFPADEFQCGMCELRLELSSDGRIALLSGLRAPPNILGGRPERLPGFRGSGFHIGKDVPLAVEKFVYVCLVWRK